MAIRAVLFDMYETLVSLCAFPPYFGKQIAADAGISPERFMPAWRGSDHDRTVGKDTLGVVLERILRENRRWDPELLRGIVEKRYAAQRTAFAHPHADIPELLRALKQRGLRIGLVSNCYREEAEYIRENALFPYFDAVCLSCEEGIAKPAPEIFLRCASRLCVSPEECLYCGDGGSSELETACELGMTAVQAVWYLRDGTGQPCGRRPEFPQAERPTDILRITEETA